MDLGLNGYLFDADGRHGNPIVISDTEEMTAFVIENVMSNHELRVVDKEDMTVFQVIDQVLIFPIPSQGSVKNKWDDELKMFATIPDA